MASFFFDDYTFPSELYDRESGDFTAPIRTLIDFAPHILQELPKQEKDQKPIHSEKQDSWTKKFLSSTGKSYFGSLLTAERTQALTEFVIRCGNEYVKSTGEKRREEERFKQYKAEDRKRRKRENRSRWFNKEKVSSSSEDEEEKMEERLRQEKEKKQAEKEKREKAQKEKATTSQDVTRSATTNNAIMTSAVAASVLSLSLYSTYQASVAFSDISFHNQLELLITQIQSIIQSTEVWIQEHEKMNDKVPKQVRTDLILVKQLVDNLIRLDPRSNKRVEAAGWGLSAVGGLSALGGFALGSAAVATGGAALAVGGVIAMVSAKAQSAGKSKLGARVLLESQVREKVKECQKNAKERERIIENDFHPPNIPVNKIKEKVETKAGEKRKLKEPLSSASTAVPKKKEKTAVLC
ncbi:hypothetical protein INT47_002607 [Mucor saturninus]|uniref:Uncharacterized protein n=1 Tax=Mucor saturninus TaxID=64648 RepID=A0A8H7V6B9_9FUNG|nr:hypothetical protein INT47_002607 [Mucor saturninus]